jgi:hypothetical protein
MIKIRGGVRATESEGGKGDRKEFVEFRSVRSGGLEGREGSAIPLSEQEVVR